jgi:hypothetical protein
MEKIAKVIPFILSHLKAVLLTGFIFAALFASYMVYINYYTSEAIISMVYPGIENGEYPNGERFMMYDIISTDRINEALEAMRAKGWYADVSADDIKTGLYIGIYLDQPVQSKVTRERQGGINYTYYSNEYYISFHQPHNLHLSDSSDFFGMLDDNLSSKFLNELLLANYKYFIANYQKNSNEYKNLAKIDGVNTDSYDYRDIADIYNLSISSCLDYLYYIQSDGEKSFVSPSTGLAFQDLIVAYETLLNIKVTELSSYAETSRLTNQLGQYLNRNAIAMERQYYSMQKKSRESVLAENAMDIYDHTFTKQIVIVGANKEDGLYQALPKTGYDTVTQQALAARVEAASYQEQIGKLTAESQEYTAAYQNKPKYLAGIRTLNAMVEDISSQYDDLLNKTLNTIADYSREYNSNYIHTIGVGNSLIGINDLIKTALVFVFFSSFSVIMIYLIKISKKAAEVNKKAKEHLADAYPEELPEHSEAQMTAAARR